MIHEVIILDHSGPELGMILFGNAVKLALFGALVVGVLVPLGLLPAWLAPWSWSPGSGWSRSAVGMVESSMARLRMNRVPNSWWRRRRWPSSASSCF